MACDNERFSWYFSTFHSIANFSLDIVHTYVDPKSGSSFHSSRELIADVDLGLARFPRHYLEPEASSIASPRQALIVSMGLVEYGIAILRTGHRRLWCL